MAQNRTGPVSTKIVQRTALIVAGLALLFAWRERAFTHNRYRYGAPDLPQRP